MSRRLSRNLAYVADQPWALHYPAAERMLAIIERRIGGHRLTQSEIDDAVAVDRDAYAARRNAARHVGSRTSGAVAVVPIYGTILGREWEFTEASHGGTTSAEGLTRTLRALDADPGVGSILLDIDSPGGSVANLPETAAVIAALAKPVVAHVNTMAASAAYWLASQADEIVASPSAELGSIGVYTMHIDEREALAAEGVSVEIIRAGDHKVAANPFEELTAEARADIQQGVDEFHAMFLTAVGAGRGVSRSKVRSEFGDGRMFRAAESVQRGMADRIATYDDTVARLAGGKYPKPRALATASRIVVSSIAHTTDATIDVPDEILEVTEAVEVVALLATLDTPIAADLDLRRRRLRLI